MNKQEETRFAFGNVSLELRWEEKTRIRYLPKATSFTEPELYFASKKKRQMIHFELMFHFLFSLYLSCNHTEVLYVSPLKNLFLWTLHTIATA